MSKGWKLTQLPMELRPTISTETRRRGQSPREPPQAPPAGRSGRRRSAQTRAARQRHRARLIARRHRDCRARRAPAWPPRRDARRARSGAAVAGGARTARSRAPLQAGEKSAHLRLGPAERPRTRGDRARLHHRDEGPVVINRRHPIHSAHELMTIMHLSARAVHSIVRFTPKSAPQRAPREASAVRFTIYTNPQTQGPKAILSRSISPSSRRSERPRPASTASRSPSITPPATIPSATT